MKTIVVLEFDLDDPEDVAGILTAIDPPKLPHPASSARIALAMPAARVLEYLDDNSTAEGSPVLPDAGALARLLQLTRDFDHYARHGDPEQGADAFFRMLHGHLTSMYLLASGAATLPNVVDELEKHDRALAADSIAAGLTTPVGSRRSGSAFGL